MRIALIADIHGNAVALETALADIDQQQVDRVICLGDLAMMGPQPHDCIERIRGLNCPVIMGNTDEWLVSDEAAGSPPDDPSPQESIAFWNVQQITAEDRAFLRGFPYTLDVTLDDAHTLRCFHGSPQSCRDMIVATTPEDDLTALLGDHTAAVWAGAHVHVQILRQQRGTTFVNPGSVGAPLTAEPAPDRPRRYTPHAAYAILEWVAAGFPSVSFRRVPYALGDLRDAVAQSGMPRSDWWLAMWPND